MKTDHGSAAPEAPNDPPGIGPHDGLTHARPPMVAGGSGAQGGNRSDAVDRLLRQAASFRGSHAGAPGLATTFGYFTRHPVAPLNRKRLGLLLDAIQVQAAQLGRPLRVLDLASGAGLITCAIAALGHTALGLDVNPGEIALARCFAAEIKSTARFQQADLLADPGWEAESVLALGGHPDVIVLAYALHHLHRVDDFVARLGAWLPPDACLLINEENPASAIWRLKHRVRTWIQHDTDVEWHRSYDAWKRLLDRVGFSTAPPRGVDMIPMLARWRPASCWSLIFVARKRP